MKSRRRTLQFLMPLGVALLGVSCAKELLCDKNGYGSGLDDCAASQLSINLSVRSIQDSQQASDRTDLRSTSALPILVDVQDSNTGSTHNLAGVPRVRLAIDGVALADIQASLDAAAPRNILVSRTPEQLQLGALQVEVTLPGLPPVTSDGLHRIFRSPKLVAQAPVTYATNAHNNAAITARLAVQIGAKGQVIITEQSSSTGVPKRWLDLYEQGATGSLVYSSDATLLQTQKDLSAGAMAMLTLVKGAIADYDREANNVLPMVPLPPLPKTTLYSNDPRILATSTSLAGCSEESAIALGLLGEVRVFQTDPTNMTLPYSFIKSLPIEGVPVLAARDALAAVPQVRSDAFFAAVWESSGKTTLLTLTKEAGKPTGFQSTVLPVNLGVNGVRAGALADLDSDGLQDLLMADANGELWWSPQHPDGSFLTASSLGLSVPGATSISVGDINNDGLPDVMVATGELGVHVLLNQP